MKKEISMPNDYTSLDDNEMLYLSGGSWSYKGHNWNDTALYARSFSRSQMRQGAFWAKVLVTTITLACKVTGNIGKSIGKMFKLACGDTDDIFKNKKWNRAVNFCFQDGLHSNLYFTAYLQNNTIISYSDDWLYTN